jgi:hypothetical protein
MKKILSIILITAVLGTFLGCEDPELPTPNVDSGGTPANLSANVLFVNAIPSTAGGSLDLYLNGVMSGNSVARAAAQTAYTNINLPTNGGFTGAVANTAIRAKATTGAIGGTLATADLIYRAGNTNTTNFSAADSAFYTIITLDSLDRGKPLRTFNTLGIGDTTYFNPLTGAYMAGKDTWALPPSQKSRRVAIGTVPLGSTDPGGVRFLVLTDQLPLPSTTRFPKPAAGRFAVRFVHAVPDAGTLSVTVNGTALTSGITSYPMNFPTFSPSVGSRSTTASFANNFGSLAPGNYDIVVKAGATTIATLVGANFTGDKGVYTIILTGQRNKNNLALVVIKNK